MSYEIKNENGINVGYIDVNGRQACIMYDPNSNPLRPFVTTEDLEAYVQEVHAKFEAMPAPEPIEIIPEGRREWHPHDFWLRFTPEAQIKIIEAARTDANVDNFRMQLLMIGKVISDHPVTVAGMGYLVSRELLTETEKNQILGGE